MKLSTKDKEIRDRISRNLFQLRTRLGLTQKKLSEASGVSVITISKIECRRQVASSIDLKKLADALLVKTDEIFTLTPTANG